MARKLEFLFGESTFICAIEKVDRSKVYGHVSTKVYDANDKPCELATIARDGRTIIPFGGTASGYVNTEGLWIDRDDLIPINRDGNKIDEVPSSFKAPISIEKEVSIEEFLDHPIRLSYLLKAKTNLDPQLYAQLKQGKIYSFPFSYRGGVYYDPAFMLTDNEENLWMLIGHKSDIEYLSFEQAAICSARAADEAEDEDENDAFDFDML